MCFCHLRSKTSDGVREYLATRSAVRCFLSTAGREGEKERVRAAVVFLEAVSHGKDPSGSGDELCFKIGLLLPSFDNIFGIIGPHSRIVLYLIYFS